MSKGTLLINGQETALIAVSDRGFQYGDGCFTTLEVREDAPLFLPQHLMRLSRDCARLQIPFDNSELLKAEAISMAAAGHDGVLKIIITRGAGGRGYRFPDLIQPTRILSFHPRPVYPPEWAVSGVVLRLCQMRLGINPRLAGIKHLNRLEQVLARNEWSDMTAQEGLLLDALGCVVEGTMSNVFLLKDDRLETPKLDRCGVVGVMRTLVMELAAERGVVVREVRCRLPQVLQADEIFLTNSLIGIWPVRRLDDREWLPGPYTHQLTQAVEAAKQHAITLKGQ